MNKKDDLDEQLQRTLRDLDVGQIDWQRRITAAEVLYLLDQCPFLQLANTAAMPIAEQPTLQNISSAPSGWKIHDYGNTLSSSPGELRFGPLKNQRDAEEEGGGSSGVGTLVNQAVITAIAMVDLAIEHSWTGIELLDGHPLMAWAAWMQALENGIEIQGYTPTAQDYARLRRLKIPGVSPSVQQKPTR